MIKGIGVDIVEIARIKSLMKNDHAKDKLLSEKEIALLKSRPKPEEFFAGRFAAKEAISKAFKVGLAKCPPTDVEVLNDKLGAPYVVLYKKAQNLKLEHNITNIHISITHEASYAVAMVILESE